MIQLSFDKEMIQEAKRLALKLGKLNNSITGGRANISAYLGELAINNYIKDSEHVSCDTGDKKYDRDLLYKDNEFEVKTKRRTVDPLPSYEASVADLSLHQDTDYYIHLSITIEKKVGTGKSAVYYKPLRIW